MFCEQCGQEIIVDTDYCENCGAQIAVAPSRAFQTPTIHRATNLGGSSLAQPQRIVVVPTKSVGLAIFLGVAFGPLGLLYSTVSGAISMFFVNIFVALITQSLQDD